jgi:hypothetical protein
MEVAVVPKSTFGQGKLSRLDAEFVRTHARALEASLKKLGSQPLAQLTSPVVGSKFERKNYSESTIVPYLDIDGVTQLDGLGYPDPLLVRDLPSRAKYVLRTGDILISNVRPNRGVVCIATKRLAGSIASSGFTRCAIKSHEMSPECVFVFLRTAHAREQLIRRNRGSMYPAVLERDVLEVQIPTLPEPLRNDLTEEVQTALALQDDFFEEQSGGSTTLDMFLKPYGSPPSPLLSVRSDLDITVIRRKMAFGTGSAERIDAEFFRREYKEFHDRLVGLGRYFRLSDHYELFAGRRTTGTDPVPTFKQIALTNAGINWSAVESERGANTEAVVREGDILLASTAHEIYYVGRKVDVVRDIPDSARDANQAVAELMILRPRPNKPKGISNGYVAAFLRHPAGLHQVQRCIRGLRGGHTYPVDLGKHVLVPLPGSSWMKNFDKQIRKSDELRRLAAERMTQLVVQCEEWLTWSGSVVDWAGI